MAGTALNGAQVQAAPQKPSIILEPGLEKFTTGYAPVNGLHVYYEIHGQGPPLILLHGGVSASEVFAPLLPELTKRRKVIAVHLRGHGHTRDVGRPLQFESMADDVADVLAYLKLPKADVLGYSLGGGVALQTAIRHPSVVDRLVVISAAMTHAGSFPEVNAAFDQMSADAPHIAPNIKGSPLGRMYPEVNWESLLLKIAELESRDFDWSAAVKQIRCKTMLVFADADSVRPEHIMAFYGALGGGQRDAGLDGSLRASAQLGIVPGTTHYNILSNPILSAMVSGFLS